ncbi:MAG: hypothetical protein HOQ11_03555 [Gemmatimonadaceae bacterium]|nr:hypothetical protein [Gemmatimonadaceae bacterium]NUR34267.1 hypothetical protein [Gemmatimonadaceae bacterium]NUS96466.1 hypothetical protein [Gemmatimonadaceae bacterium]
MSAPPAPSALATQRQGSAARAIALFGVVAVVVMLVAGGIVAVFYDTWPERRAILISAAVALGLQLLVFVGIRLVPREHVIAAWGVGAIARFAVLVLYAMVVVKALALPSGAALVSLATFLFVLTVLEPPFLKL